MPHLKLIHHIKIFEEPTKLFSKKEVPLVCDTVPRLQRLLPLARHSCQVTARRRNKNAHIHQQRSPVLIVTRVHRLGLDRRTPLKIFPLSCTSIYQFDDRTLMKVYLFVEKKTKEMLIKAEYSILEVD